MALKFLRDVAIWVLAMCLILFLLSKTAEASAKPATRFDNGRVAVPPDALQVHQAVAPAVVLSLTAVDRAEARTNGRPNGLRELLTMSFGFRLSAKSRGDVFTMSLGSRSGRELSHPVAGALPYPSRDNPRATSMMLTYVRPLSFKQLQVLKTVVVANPVDVMDGLVTRKGTA